MARAPMDAHELVGADLNEGHPVGRAANTTGPRKRRRRRMIWIALLVLVVAEVAARLLVGHPQAEPLPTLQVRAHPTCGWAMVPNSWHRTYAHKVKVNAFGLRGPEPVQGPGPKVVVVGDTFVYGLGLADHETFPAQLQTAMDGHAVVNAGVRGYSTNQEVALLDELQEQTDGDVIGITVFCWQWDDLYETNIGAAHNRIEGRGDVAFDTRTKIEGWTWWKWQGRELLRRSALLMTLHEWRKTPADQIPRNPDWNRVIAQLEQARAVSKSNRFVLFVVPHPLGIHDKNFPSRELEQQLLARWQGQKIYPLEPLRTAFSKPPVIPYDGHYAAEAMAVMAQSVAHALATRSD